MRHESSIMIECSESSKYYLKQLTQHSRDKTSFFADQLSDENRLRKRFFVTRIFTFRAYTMLRDMKFDLELRAWHCEEYSNANVILRL